MMLRSIAVPVDIIKNNMSIRHFDMSFIENYAQNRLSECLSWVLYEYVYQYKNLKSEISIFIFYIKDSYIHTYLEN